MERVGWLLRVFAVGGLLAAGLLVGDGAGGGPARASRAVTVVRPPAPYSLPSGAVWVHNSRQLVRALARTHATNIVLAAGVYDHGEPFYVRNGNRLYAARVGQAVLRAGIALGANSGGSGPLLRGLRFDVRDPRRTLNDNVIHVWGTGSRARILDTTVAGHGRIDAGIFVRQVEGFVAKRVVVRGFRSYGVLVDPNTSGYRARGPYLLEDVAVSRVARPTHGSSRGTAEACFWLGSRGFVRRASARQCGLEGIWTGTANTGSRLQDVEIDRTQVGIYLEHFTRGAIFERLRVGPHVRRGVNAEWADPSWGGRPASVDNVFRNSSFKTSVVGVYLDEGTTRTSVIGCTFAGQSWAGIGNYLGIGNRFAGNDFKGLLPGAVPISLGHI
jgi:hypothetical protein